MTIQYLGTCLQRQGKLDEAEQLLRQALARFRSAQGDEHWRTHWALHHLARLLRERGKLDEAERLGAEAVRKGRQTWLHERPQGAATFLIDHAKTLTVLARFEQAEIELLKAQIMLEDSSVAIAAPVVFKRETRKLAQAFVDLYDARHTSEPDSGYNAKAAQWRIRLEKVRAEEAQIDPLLDSDG